MSSRRKKIAVIGSGVSGLTSGIRCLEAGFDVTLFAREPAHATTSSVAAALWYPYKAWPEDRVLGWGATAYAEFAKLALIPESGVTLPPGIELFRTKVSEPWWHATVPGFRRATRPELPAGYEDGWVFSAPVIEMPIYLDWLLARFTSLGGRIVLRALRTLEEAFEGGDLAINCSGLGARELSPDPSMIPVRGIVVRVAQVGITSFMLDDHGPDGVTYIVPRSRDCVLGGSAEEGEEALTIDEKLANGILARCRALEPRLRAARVLESKVGIRPVRPTVRLEAEQRAGGRRVIHNYGHGGAGVTLSWGCADEALRLACAD